MTGKITMNCASGDDSYIHLNTQLVDNNGEICIALTFHKGDKDDINEHEIWLGTEEIKQLIKYLNTNLSELKKLHLLAILENKEI